MLLSLRKQSCFHFFIFNLVTCPHFRQVIALFPLFSLVLEFPSRTALHLWQNFLLNSRGRRRLFLIPSFLASLTFFSLIKSETLFRIDNLSLRAIEIKKAGQLMFFPTKASTQHNVNGLTSVFEMGTGISRILWPS